MSKKMGLYLMLAGAAVSAWELVQPGAVYGAGKPLAPFRWKVYQMMDKSLYVSISDLAALAGAAIYFKG
jgi:hypothetical protein